MARIGIICFLLSIVMIGCAEIEPPRPERILAPWNSAPPLRLGENKDSIKDKWGEPDDVRQLGADDVGIAKEEWVYRSRYQGVPADYKSQSRTKRLIFTGDSLTDYKTGEEEKIKTETPFKNN